MTERFLEGRNGIAAMIKMVEGCWVVIDFSSPPCRGVLYPFISHGCTAGAQLGSDCWGNDMGVIAGLPQEEKQVIIVRRKFYTNTSRRENYILLIYLARQTATGLDFELPLSALGWVSEKMYAGHKIFEN